MEKTSGVGDGRGTVEERVVQLRTTEARWPEYVMGRIGPGVRLSPANFAQEKRGKRNWTAAGPGEEETVWGHAQLGTLNM